MQQGLRASSLMGGRRGGPGKKQGETGWSASHLRQGVGAREGDSVHQPRDHRHG